VSIAGDEPCPKCVASGGDKTGNHLIIFEDGNKHCNRCGYTEINGSIKNKIEEEEAIIDFNSVEAVQTLPFFGIPHRNISVEACEQYGVRTEFDDKGEPVAWYYPSTKDGRITGYKRKTRDKRIISIGDTKAGELFGGGTTNSGGKFCVITEGEEDALSVWDTLRSGSDLDDWRPAVFSLPHGCSAADRDIANNLEGLERYERVVLCFDEDEPGRKAADVVAPLLSGRAYITKLSRKDANEMVLEGLGNDLKWAVLSHAKRYQPDGIIDGADTWDRYKKSTNKDCIKYPESWVDLNTKTYGFRLGEVITWTAGTSVGKTQILRQIKHWLWSTTNYKVADISLEEDVGDTVAGLMGLHMGQRIHLPDVEVDEAHEREVHKQLFGDGRFTFYDYFGGMDDDNLFNKLRYFGATGHRIIFLDHLSIIVSEYAAEGNERQRIDTVMTKLAKIAKEMNCAIHVIVHLRKEGLGRSFEQGAIPSLDDLRGSGSLKQLSWDVIALSRDQQHPSKACRNTSRLTVLKCRFSGNTGEAGYLQYNTDTGRMEACPKPAGYDRDTSKL
jgi:twinkle protein